jgi:dTDP-4-dehydrorhamnose 3,5-epimerase/CDP-3, 6-dideoxy-D-glycero-D-glycero-4-hexulose-5-epimerase
MKIKETFIKGLFEIKHAIFNDLRGELFKPFISKEYSDSSLNYDFKEIWFTRSHKNVIRAMHMQAGDSPCEKLITVINGRITDVILDLREDSKTYGEYFTRELSPENRLAMYIPIGCAHGYKVHEDNTVVMYAGTKPHSAKDDIGVRWDSFGYDWQSKDFIISDRDKELPKFLVKSK